VDDPLVQKRCQAHNARTASREKKKRGEKHNNEEEAQEEKRGKERAVRFDLLPTAGEKKKRKRGLSSTTRKEKER